MAAGHIHFEVYFKKSRKHAWTLIEAAPSRDAAITRAKALLAETPAGSARVSKETYDEAERVFRALTVFEQGGEKYEDDGRADRKRELPCRSAADLVQPHARDAIARSLKGFLKRQKATTLELLHRVDLVEKLEASGTELQHAVQKVAIAQASQTDSSAQHFVKQLNQLVQSAIEKLYGEIRNEGFPKLKKGELADVCARIAGAPDRERKLRGAVAQRLKSAADWKTKLERLLDLAEEARPLAPEAAWPLNVVGEFIGEAVCVDDARAALLRETSDLGEQLDGLTGLFGGPRNASPFLSEAGARLSGFFVKDLFSEARAAIARKILSELKSTKRLRPTNFQSEVQLNRSLAERLIMSATPLISGGEIAEAFVTRSSRLLEPEAIEALIAAAPAPSAELTLMLELEENIVGEHNKRKLAAYVRARCGAHQVESYFVYGLTPALGRLAELAEIVRLLARTGFDAKDKAEMTEKLDALAIAIEEREQIFAKLDRRAMPPLDKALAYLRLVGKGVVPPGRLTDAARRRATKLLASPEARAALAESADARVTAKEIAELMAATRGDAKAA